MKTALAHWAAKCNTVCDRALAGSRELQKRQDGSTPKPAAERAPCACDQSVSSWKTDSSMPVVLNFFCTTHPASNCSLLQSP